MLEEGTDDWDQDELDLNNLGQQPSVDSSRDEVEVCTNNIQLYNDLNNICIEISTRISINEKEVCHRDRVQLRPSQIC